MRRYRFLHILLAVALVCTLVLTRSAPARASTPHLDDNRIAGSITVDAVTALLGNLTGLPLGALGLVFTGRVVPHPQLYNVFWGDSWSNSPGSATRDVNSMPDINAFTSNLTQDGYFDAASQYSVGSASFKGSHEGTSCGSPGSTESFLDILAWITCEVQVPGTGVPYPDTNEGDTIYNVWLPTGTIPAEAKSTQPGVACSGFTAYHSMSAALTIQLVGGIVPVPDIQQYAYTVLPVDCAGDFDGLTANASHEMIEASTDPNFGIGWIDLSTFDFGALDHIAKAGEAADICEPGAGAAPTDSVRLDDGTLVAPYWSNAANSGAGACEPQTYEVDLGETGLPGTVPHHVDLTGAAVGNRGVTYLPQTLQVVAGGHIAWSFPSPVADPNPGIRYLTSDPGSGGTTVISGPVTDTATYSQQDHLTVQTSPASVQPSDTALTPSAWEANGVTVGLSTDAIIPSGADRYRFTSWGGNVANSSSPTTTVVMSGPQTVTANYAFQHLLTVKTSGLPSPNLTHVTLGGATLGTANDPNPLAVWVNDGTSLATFNVDGDVNGAGGVQYFFQGFVPAPAATLTAQLTTTAGYLTMAQIISNALASSGLTGPSAAGEGASLTSKFSIVQADMAVNSYTTALGDTGGFINQVQAQAGKEITPATARTLQLDASMTYHLALCLGASQLSASQQANDYSYYQNLVAGLGGTVLPPC
jgi:hypothetical protein